MRKSIVFLIPVILMTVLFLLGSMLWTLPVNAQEWTTANQITASWDAVTVPSGTVSYKTYHRLATGGPEVFIASTPNTQYTYTFSVEGRYFLGVRSVRTVDGLELESETISWSDNPAICQGGVTFGIQYYSLPPQVINLRR